MSTQTEKPWSKRVALVTGAAQGMGRACAERFATLGASVALFDQSESVLATAETMAERGAKASGFVGDVRLEDDLARLVASAEKRWGRIDILVHAAGVLRPTSILELEREEWDWVISVNLTGAYLATRAVLGSMKAQNYGRIVHFSSSAGKTVSTIGGAHYTASKHGVLGLTRAVAKELAPFGITVNAVCPGLIDTEMVRGTIASEDVERYAKSFPIARLGTSSEIADSVCFLIDSPYITGVGLDINGGDLMI